MKEIRTINRGKVQDICIKYNWYTRGILGDYNNMLAYVESLTDVTMDNLEKIAIDILINSDTECEILNIMFILANECCTTFFEYEQE